MWIAYLAELTANRQTDTLSTPETPANWHGNFHQHSASDFLFLVTQFQEVVMSSCRVVNEIQKHGFVLFIMINYFGSSLGVHGITYFGINSNICRWKQLLFDNHWFIIV